ncbi:MAG: MerR family transcriptional regulator [Paracoccaceae bacterium]
MAEKSRDAFRTISEVADWLDVPTHVLRFWESRFSQIKPVKRAGGRRYYRPSDMRVIGGVKVLLHDQGMTIRGVQKLFREEGVKHVAGYAPDLFEVDVPQESTAAPLNEAALERAARPASAARATHEAAPDPDVEDTAEVSETADLPEAAPDTVPMFRRARSEPVPPEETAEVSVEPHREPEADAPNDTAEEETTAPAPRIPETPDVPVHDCADDDAEHATGPGLAARLKLVDAEALTAHRATLQEAAARLRTLLSRAE